MRPRKLSISVNNKPSISSLIIPVLVGIVGWCCGYIIAMEQVKKTYIKQLEITAFTETIEPLAKLGSTVSGLEGYLTTQIKHNKKDWYKKNEFKEEVFSIFSKHQKTRNDSYHLLRSMSLY